MQRFLLACAASLAIATNAAAEQLPVASPPSNDWQMTLGIAPIYAPAFQGSKDYQFQAFPDIRVNYGGRFFASIPEGVGYHVINSNGWRIGPIVKYRFKRDEEDGTSPFRIAGPDIDALRGLGSVDGTVEAGGYIEHRFQQLPLQARIELRQGLNGHEGTLADFALRYMGGVGPFRYSIGPKMSLANSDFMQAYYGVNAVQSANSGLAQYDARGGLLSYGIGGFGVMPLTTETSITFFGSYDRLGQKVADAPLVDERGSANQFMAGASIGYRFGL